MVDGEVRDLFVLIAAGQLTPSTSCSLKFWTSRQGAHPHTRKRRLGKAVGEFSVARQAGGAELPVASVGAKCQTSAKRHMPPMRAAAMITRTAMSWAVTAVLVASVM